MGLMARIRDALPSRARDRPRASAQSEGAGGRTGALTRPQTYSLASVEMGSSEMIYAAVTRIGSSLGTMPCHFYRGYERVKDDPRDGLLGLRPNREMSAFAFKRAMESYRNIEGRAYAVKRFDGAGRLCELAVIDPRRVTPLRDDATGDIWYCVRRDDGQMEYLHNWYVIALHHMSTNGLSAIRVVDVLRGSIQYAESVKNFSLESIKGINSGIVLEFPTTMGRDARKRAVADFVQAYRDSGGQVLALESGVSAHTLTGTAIDSDAFDVEGVTRTRIATVYGMSPYWLGDTAAGSGKNAEQLQIEFLSFTMHPIVELWEQELDFKLLTPQERAAGYAFRFDIEAALRADSGTLASLHQSQVRCGSRTPNEIRQKDYLPPLDGGDVGYLSKDLAPMKLVAEGGTLDADKINGEQNARKGGKEP